MDYRQGKILVVDDNRLNRLTLERGLQQQGHLVTSVENGQEALEILQIQSFDLMLLDIAMPQMDGFQLLEVLKRKRLLRGLPVIVISAIEEMTSVIRCVEIGAEDYLPKPFDPILLKARIEATLEKKWLRDQERAYIKRLKKEKEKSERLLLNVLPQPIAHRLKQGESVIADSFDEVTVLFIDIVNFNDISANMSPTEVVILLNVIFSTLDRLAEKHGLEKIKTLGATYLVVGGLPHPRPDHVEAVADMALDVKKESAHFDIVKEKQILLRMGIHTGPVVAGIIGTQKFSYDLWGNTVNLAQRMQSHGMSNRIQVSSAVYERLKEKYLFQERGTISLQSYSLQIIEEMCTYFLMKKIS